MEVVDRLIGSGVAAPLGTAIRAASSAFATRFCGAGYAVLRRGMRWRVRGAPLASLTGSHIRIGRTFNLVLLIGRQHFGLAWRAILVNIVKM